MSDHDDSDPQPSDPPFLVAILLAARRARDRELESLARDWLAERGIRVVLDDDRTFTGGDER